MLHSALPYNGITTEVLAGQSSFSSSGNVSQQEHMSRLASGAHCEGGALSAEGRASASIGEIEEFTAEALAGSVAAEEPADNSKNAPHKSRDQGSCDPSRKRQESLDSETKINSFLSKLEKAIKDHKSWVSNTKQNLLDQLDAFNAEKSRITDEVRPLVAHDLAVMERRVGFVRLWMENVLPVKMLGGLRPP